MGYKSSEILKQFDAVERQVHYVKESVSMLRGVYTGLHEMLAAEGISGMQKTGKFSEALIDVISALTVLESAAQNLVDEGNDTFKTFGNTKNYRTARRNALRRVRRDFLR